MVRGEALEDDAVRREAAELRDEVSFGGAVLGPEGRNEQDRDPVQVGGDVAQEVPARGIDPVHVVDDEDEPAAARDVPEELRDGIEEELLPVLRVCRGQVDGRQRRDQPGELWSDIAGEFADERVAEGVEQPPDGVAPGRIGHPVDTASRATSASGSRAANSSRRRVFPMPASPLTSTSAPRVGVTRSRAADSRRRESSRPIR